MLSTAAADTVVSENPDDNPEKSDENPDNSDSETGYDGLFGDSNSSDFAGPDDTIIPDYNHHTGGDGHDESACSIYSPISQDTTDSDSVYSTSSDGEHVLEENNINPSSDDMEGKSNSSKEVKPTIIK